MPTFIENCNCKGNRPSGIVGLKHNLRPNLTGRLLNDRHSARYIVAPGGYGKSSLAYEYAQIVFEFKHVFWIRCDSPCFLRDLDDGGLCESIFAVDDKAKLVVCDDLPQLDFDRTQAFGDFVDSVLENDCEVIVCCTPSRDTVSSLSLDSVQIRANDMLLSDEEVETERLRGYTVGDFDLNGKQCRIASFIWSEGKNSDVVNKLSQEHFPTSVRCEIFSMLVLGEGELSDIEVFLDSKSHDEDLAYLCEDYPFLGIDLEDGTFQTMEFEMADVAKCMGKELSVIFGTSPSKRNVDEIAFGFADALIERANCGRGAEFMKLYGRRAARRKWLSENCWSLVFLPDPFSMLIMLEESVDKGGKPDSTVFAAAAWAAYILGDESAAESYCYKGLRESPFNSARNDAFTLLLGIIKGEDFCDSRKQKRRGAEIADAFDEDGSESICPAPIDWSLALELHKAMIDGDAEFLELWNKKIDAYGDFPEDLFEMRTLMFSGALYIERLLKSDPRGERDWPWEEISSISAHTISMIDAPTAEFMGWPEYFAVKALERFSDTYPFHLSTSLRIQDIASMRKIDMRLFEQTGKWKAKSSNEIRKKGEFELTHPDPFRRNAMKASELSPLRVTTPTLFITLFGGLFCRIGNQNEEAQILSREKAKTLLAMISLNHGKEVSREKLVRALWPDSSFEAANKNLYVVWSYLKRSLSVGQSCPYLLRTQNGFSLDMRYVSCDLADFEELCRNLIFGTDEMLEWEEMYESVRGRFSEDLLPTITNNSRINSARKMYRDQLVDGLVAASHRLYAQGEARGATWYAREAKRRDPAREDVYIALMGAQIASDQRACALDTYFECRKYLSETLGIDPSAKIMELYRSIIEEEQDF